MARELPNGSVSARPASRMSQCGACDVRERTLCAPLSLSEQERLMAITTMVSVADASTIFSEGDPSEHLFNVTQGTVKLYKLMADGRRQITGFLFPGDFLGLTHSAIYAYSAEAIGRVALCRFPRRRLEILLDEFPQMEKWLLGRASNELAAAQDQMLLLGRKTAREKIASFLTLMSRRAVQRGEPGNPVLLPMTRSDIADYLGLTIETVSRTLSKLKTEGAIELIGNGAVKLRNPELLADAAEGE